MHQNLRMRSPRALLIAAGLLIIAGLLLWFVPLGDEGGAWFAYTGSGGLPWLVFMTTTRAVGVALFWVGSLLAAGVVGHRLAARQTASA